MVSHLQQYLELLGNGIQTQPPFTYDRYENMPKGENVALIKEEEGILRLITLYYICKGESMNMGNTFGQKRQQKTIFLLIYY